MEKSGNSDKHFRGEITPSEKNSHEKKVENFFGKIDGPRINFDKNLSKKIDDFLEKL